MRRFTQLAVYATMVAAAAVFIVGAASGASGHKHAVKTAKTTAVAAFTESNHVSFTLEGCRNDGTITLPNGSGQFICPDAAYTTGNLGKGWNELDLVPHRLTTSLGNQAGATTDYDVYIAADYQTSGKIGYDVISVPVLNAAKSDASCSVSAGPQSTQGSASSPFGGGTDIVVYRDLTIHQSPGTTCVFDYYQRLALGAHLYPGSSLQSYMFAGAGLTGSKKTISIPVNQIAPQTISKTMSASRNTDHIWTLEKQASPANYSFGNVCSANFNPTVSVSVTIKWVKSAAQPTGPATIITHVYATNPSARTITVNVSDVIYQGLSQTTQVTGSPTASGSVDVPANTANFEVVEHTATDSSGAANYNDVATATYTDKVTGIPVPGTTTASANAAVQSGTELNPTASISDSESITGSGLSFAVAAPSFGSFTGYTAGTYTTGPVVWGTLSQSDSNQITFSKTVKLDPAQATSGTLSDTATLTGSDGASATASATSNFSSTSTSTLTVTKTIPNVLQGNETASFTFDVIFGGNTVATQTVQFAAGDTSKTLSFPGLAQGSYTVHEQSASGWKDQSDQPVDITGCTAGVEFDNQPAPATAKAVKVTSPTGYQSGWTMLLNGPNATNVQAVTDGNGNATFPTSLVEGSYTITETAQNGWTQQSATGDCSFTVNYPTDAGKTFTCTITNVGKGNIVVTKQTSPAGSPQSFSFTTGGAGYAGFSLTDGQSNDSGPLLGGSGYSVAETGVSGWTNTSATCDGGNTPGSITVVPAQTVHCTFVNTQSGHIIVKKVTDPKGSSQSFTFTPSYNGGATFGLTDGQSNDSGALAPGGYSVSEAVPTGWDQTSATCDNGNSPSAITLGAGQTITCTFLNTQRAKIIVKKVTVPSGSAQAFTFTPTGYNNGATFSLSDGQSNDSGPLLPASGYSVSEAVPAGWDQTSATCDNGNSPSAITLTAGQTVTCTFTNTQRAHLIVKKVTNPSGSSQSFDFTSSGPNGYSASFSLADGQSNDSGAVKPGSGYSASETVPAGWKQTSATCDNGNAVTSITLVAGQTVTCTFTNTQQGKAKVIKTFSGQPPSGTQTVDFQLRTGASPTLAGTIVETQTLNAANSGTVTFSTYLTPGSTYQMCEVLGPLGPGWTTTLGPPLYSVYNPSGDNSTVCTDFTVTAGQTVTFTIDNTPPPGGLGFTIGYWKNWASCASSKGSQAHILDQTLAIATGLTTNPPGGLVVSAQTAGSGWPNFGPTYYLVLKGSTSTPNTAPDCSKAVNLLNKTTVDGKTKKSSDPLFNMTAQLVGAQLNFFAGAGKSAAAISNVQKGVLLDGKYQFNGNTYTPKLTAADTTLANCLATQLDNYNNNKPNSSC